MGLYNHPKNRSSKLNLSFEWLFICYLRPAFDRAQKPALNSTNTSMNSYRPVIVPDDITPKFLQVAQRNTG